MLNEKKFNKDIYTSSTESIYESDFKDDNLIDFNGGPYVSDFKDNKNISMKF
jgi:hypothetical protein